MRKLTITITLFLLAAVAVTAQVRGRGRLQGVVTDQATGKPVAGASITVSHASEDTQPILSKTDKNGRWSALGLTGGMWNIDIVADGYETTRGSANVSELQLAPTIKTGMVPAQREEPETTVEVATTGPVIPQEAIDAIDQGQGLLKVKAGDVVTATETGTPVSHTVTAEEAKSNAQRAVAEFEKALALIPEDNEPARPIRSQLMNVMAQAYYRAGDLPKAIAMLEQLNAVEAGSADPAAAARKLLLVNLYLEHGNLDKGKALLEGMPATAVTDPTVYVNIGILFLNQQRVADAVGYFTKAIDLNPKDGVSYHYRGLARMQLQKLAEARADFQQVILLAPDTPEARDAQQMLDALAKTK